MFWADKFAQQIIQSGKYKPYWVDDMKTPSGRIHVGALRGVITHDLIYKALMDAGVKVTFTYVIDDHDPMDALPVYLDKRYEEYMGQPLNTIPSPKPDFKSYAQYFAQDFIEVFNACGCQPKIIWASELYKSGRLNKGIKKCLDNAPKIRKIYKKVSGSAKPKDWYPFQVICENCGKVGTTKVINWDGEKVTYKCLPNLVGWARGCGYTGKISPLNGTGKLPWKIEWPVKWQAIGVTIEGAGKDHMSKGGSHDIAAAVCQEILDYPVPFAFSHEHFLLGGRKMSSSKGIGASAREMYNLLPPELLRFLITRPRYNRAIDFDLEIPNTIPNLFNDYDACAQEYYTSQSRSYNPLDYKKGTKSDFGRIWQLSQIKPIVKEVPFLPVFLDVANYIQLSSVDIYKKFAEIKGGKLTKIEKEILAERIKFAKIWLESYAPKEIVYKVTKKVPPQAKDLSAGQKKYLKELQRLLEKDWDDPEKLQFELYELAKRLKLSSKIAFQAIYLSLIGKTHGPKAAWLLLEQDKKFLIKRLKEVVT